jgi:hypothetical protein
MVRTIPLYVALMVGLGAVAARAGTPFGGDDSGFVPPTAAANKCASTAHKAELKYADALVAGHIKLLGVAFKAGAAQADDGPGSFEDTARKKVEAAQAMLSSCDPCLTSAFASLNASTEIAVDLGTELDLFCDGTQEAFDGDDSGKIPTSQDALKCETTFGKIATKYQDGIVKCHINFATARFKGAAFDEEGCETKAVQSYRKALSKLKGCPPCSGSCPPCDPTTKVCGPCSGHMASLEAGFNNGLDTVFLPEFYCASPSGAFVDGVN